MKFNKKLSMCAVAFVIVLEMLLSVSVFAGETYIKVSIASDTSDSLKLDAVSAILVEAETGTVLYEKNADEKLPPASVTKVMTILLTMEAVDSGKISLDDMINVSEDAASMGGSQVYLKVGEQMSVNDMLKSVVVASANDCAYALAEYICGSESEFVQKMNERAAQLGMENTNFENTNGLDDDTVNHVTSARDIALMSSELISNHPKVLEYSSIWMDSIREGAFGLTNTNRLIRFYNGANGLKTGSTAKAKFCISASAKRDGMQLIAVIMASPTRDVRNECAKKLLDFGFAKYSYVTYDSEMCKNVRVLGGISSETSTVRGSFRAVLNKGDETNVNQNIILPECISAPVKTGDIVGSVEYILNGDVIGKCDIVAGDNVEKISYLGLFGKLIKKFLLI